MFINALIMINNRMGSPINLNLSLVDGDFVRVSEYGCDFL